MTCAIEKIKESKKPRTSWDFLRLGAWMNGGGELRRQSKCGGKDDEYRHKHVKSEGSIGYPGE